MLRVLNVEDDKPPQRTVWRSCPFLRHVAEMTYFVSSGTKNLNSKIPFLHQPEGGYTTEYVMRGQCDVGLTYGYLPGQKHCHCPLAGTNFPSARVAYQRLHWPGWMVTNQDQTRTVSHLITNRN